MGGFVPNRVKSSCARLSSCSTIFSNKRRTPRHPFEWRLYRGPISFPKPTLFETQQSDRNRCMLNCEGVSRL
jgi:hypothetical protein